LADIPNANLRIKSPLLCVSARRLASIGAGHRRLCTSVDDAGRRSTASEALFLPQVKVWEPIARFRVLRTTVHHRPPAFVTSPNRRPAAAGERPRTGVNEPKTEPRPRTATNPDAYRRDRYPVSVAAISRAHNLMHTDVSIFRPTGRLQAGTAPAWRTRLAGCRQPSLVTMGPMRSHLVHADVPQWAARHRGRRREGR
jgi:hypothetical protein